MKPCSVPCPQGDSCWVGWVGLLGCCAQPLLSPLPHLHGQRLAVLGELLEDGVRILDALLVLLGLQSGRRQRSGEGRRGDEATRQRRRRRWRRRYRGPCCVTPRWLGGDCICMQCNAWLRAPAGRSGLPRGPGRRSHAPHLILLGQLPKKCRLLGWQLPVVGGRRSARLGHPSQACGGARSGALATCPMIRAGTALCDQPAAVPSPPWLLHPHLRGCIGRPGAPDQTLTR